MSLGLGLQIEPSGVKNLSNKAAVRCHAISSPSGREKFWKLLSRKESVSGYLHPGLQAKEAVNLTEMLICNVTISGLYQLHCHHLHSTAHHNHKGRFTSRPYAKRIQLLTTCTKGDSVFAVVILVFISSGGLQALQTT